LVMMSGRNNSGGRKHRWGKKLQRIISVLYEINFIPS
jgi:hypothetical protein